MISAELVSDAQDLRSIEPRWDDFARRLRAPYCSPGWTLAWWRHVADPRSALRIVVVREGEDVVGIAPFFAIRDFGVARYGLLAADVSFPVDPLAAPGYERSVASSVVDIMAEADPKPDLVSLDGTLATTRWAEMLAGAWPGGTPHVRRLQALPSPTLVLHGRTYEEWLASKSSNFRQQMKRFRRRLERKGATFRLATDPNDIERGLRAFLAMHHARWGSKGGSNLAKPGLHAMLTSVAARFAGSLRFRLWLLDVDGSIVSAQIFLEAGGDVAYWNGGFDEGWAAERPALQTILAAVEHAFSVGDRRVSFGGGAHEYKSRFADDGEDDLLEWTTLLPITPRYPLARLRLVPADLRTTVSNRLSETSRQRLRSLWRHRSTQGANT